MCLTVEFDSVNLWSGSLNLSSLSDLSRGEFDRIAVPRLLATFRRFGVTCTWFVPGAVVTLFPELVRDIVSDGHEVAHHGWAHEALSRDPTENRRLLERGIEAIERVTGAAPVGYRVPGGSASGTQLELLAEYDFAWDSSLSGSDFSPYYLRPANRIAADGSYEFGSAVDLVEIPVSWNLDDFPAFEFVWGFNAGLSTPSNVLEIWRGDFDFMRERVPDGVFAPCVHSQVIARGHRLLMLEKLLAYLCEFSDTRFETVATYVRRWKRKNPFGDLRNAIDT